MSGEDKALQLLMAEGEQAAQGSEQHKENFDTFLTQMASADNPDMAMRSAALQMRLPDVKVDTNEQGNLSFSARTQQDPAIPKDFATKRVTTVDSNTTTIVGENGEVNVLSLGLPGFKDQAKRANTLHSTSNKRTANLLNRLSDIEGIGDIKERERALIDLSGSIDLALNDRKLELVQQAGMRFNVPQLETRLREAEAADRADPRWSDFQHDSPLTAQIRQETERARQNAIAEADRNYVTDSVANELTVKRTQVTNQFKSDAASAAADMTPDELFSAAYGKDDQLAARAFYRAAQGKEGTAKEVVAFIQNNKTLQGLLAGDQSDVLVHAFTAGTSDSAMVRQAVYAMEVDKVGATLAEQRIKDLDTTYKRLLAVVKADEDDLSQYADLANIPDIQALRAEEQATLGIASTKSAAEQKAYKAGLPRRLMQVAQQVAQTKEIDRFFNSTDMDYPTATDPAMQAMVEEARNGNYSIGWMIELAADSPVDATALRNYVDAMWIDNYDSVLLGSSVDTQRAVAQMVNAKLVGLSGQSIVAPQTNMQKYVTNPMDEFNQWLVSDDPIRDSLQSLAEAVYSVTPFGLFDWLQSPAKEGDK